MQIELVLFRSVLHDQASVMAARHTLISQLKKMGDLSITESDNYKPSAPSPESVTICFIATGGTEEIFSKIAEKLPQPIILLCDGYHNSMAATFEIATWLSYKGMEFEMINIPSDFHNLDFIAFKISCIQLKSIMGGMYATNLPKRKFSRSIYDSTLEGIYAQESVSKYLNGSVVGLIGGESSWLISSQVDTEYISGRFGTSFVHIDIGEIISNYLSLPENIPLEHLPAGFSDSTREKEIKEALKMYKVLSDICEKYSLTALTVKCFDLLEACCTTSCLALAMLNDQGIIAGCEGDIPALWTMMIGYALSGKSSFMANPASSSEEEYTIDFAHCSIPFTMTKSYSLPSHFESGIGVGIAGEVVLGQCSIVKIAGEKLDRLFTINGEIVANTKIPQRCRSQIRIQVEGKDIYDSFFNNRFGNHVIITPYIFNGQ